VNSKALPAFTAIFLAATVASATPVNYSLGQFGQLGLDLPEGWTANSQGKDAEGGGAVKITPGGGFPLVLLMTPLAAANAEDLDAAAQQAVEAAKPGLAKNAVETELPVKDLESEGSHAWYVSATDKTVEAGTGTSFKHVDQGAAAVGRLLVSFTILTNANDGAEHAQALEIVKSARHLSAGPPWRTPQGGVAVSYPGKAWKLALDLPGFEMAPTQLGREGKGVRLAGKNKTTGMVVTVFLEEAHAGSTAVAQREDAWKTMQTASPMDRQDVKRSERGPMAILEMRVPTYWGREVNQKSVNAYLVRDGVLADVHLSKVRFQDSDMELFEKVLGTVRFVD
jgi:hypothetical protein